MPPVQKKDKTVATVEKVAEPVVATPVPVKVVEPVPEKKKVVSKKVVEPVVPVPVVVPEVVSDVSTEKSAEESTDNNAIQSLVEKIGNLSSLVKEIQTSLKPVIKEYEKQLKVIQRIQKKRENARKSPSGFAKPNKISDELCDFIGVAHGTEKSRTEITRYINAYVKEHNLNNPANRRVIIPDDKLKSILKIKEGEEVTFFILQRLISHHFPTSASKQVA